MKIEKQYWDIILVPEKKWFDLKLKEVYRYRDLLMLFVKRDIISFYKQTILGPIWYFIQPIFTTIIYTFVFGNLAGVSTSGIPKPLFYLAGITAWNYFADCLIKTSTTFKDNASIFGKVYFPRIISPLSIVISNLLKYSIQMILFFLLLIYYKFFTNTDIEISFYILLYPIFVILMGLQGLGLGMLVTSMTIKYRDLAYLLNFGVQLMVYTTTVIYPLSSLKGKTYLIVALNPITYIIEGIKRCLLGTGVLNLNTFTYSIIVTVIIFACGILTFNKVEKSFIDTI